MEIDKQFQIKLINDGEKEIKDNIIKYNNIWHQKYGLLDKELFNKYQKYLYSMSNDTIRFSLKFENINSNFLNQAYELLTPHNFVLIKEEIIYSYLDDNNNKNQQQNLIYDIFMGGECLIIKDKNYNNVYYVSEYNINNSFQYNNSINFILIYKDENQFNCELNKIMQKGFPSYLNEYNISKDGQSHNIYDSNGILIGLITHNFLRHTETFNILMDKNVIKQDNFQKKVKKAPEMNQILHSIMLCLFQTKQLVNELYNDYCKAKIILVQLFVQYFEKIQKDCSEINFKLISQFNPNMTKTYKDIISEMFSRLDKDLTITKMKDTYKHGQINQFSETTSIKKINEEYQNGSIIKKLFHTIFEIKAVCNCGISNYSYEHRIFLFINLNEENNNVSISEKFFNYKNPKSMQCQFCREKINSPNEIKVVIYPIILIVILEGENYNNFSLKSQKEININKRIYKLYCLCEKNPNTFYFKSNNKWYDYIENQFMEVKGIEATKPVILFYKFSGSIIQNNQNINNNKINMSEKNANRYMNWKNINNNIINSNSQNKVKYNINNNIYNMININNMNMNNNLSNKNNINNNININYNNNYYINNAFVNNFYNNVNSNKMNMNNLPSNNLNNNMNMNIINNNMNLNNIMFNNMNMNNNLNSNNFKMNNYMFNNNMNINQMNNFNNNILLKGKSIFLTFILNNKQIFIQSNENETLENIIFKLENKYNWVKNVNKTKYLYNNQEIVKRNYTLKQLNIPDNSTIIIL